MVFRTCIKWVAGGRTLTQVRFERQGGTLWPLDRASPGSTSPCRGSVFCGDPVLGRLSPRGAKDGPSHLRLCLVLPEVVEREGLFPQHPWQFQGQLWYKQFGRVVIAESVGHQDIGVSPEVVGGGGGGHMVIFIQSVGERALVPEGPGRLVRPQSETSSGTWGHTAAQKGRQAFACPRPPWGSPWGYVSRSPGRPGCWLSHWGIYLVLS